MTNHENFLQAIHEKKIVKVKINTYEKGIIERYCIPFDFGPSRRNLQPNPDRYHFYDLDSPENKHNLSIIPTQLLELEITENGFDPSHYITRTPNRFIPRNRGIYS